MKERAGDRSCRTATASWLLPVVLAVAVAGLVLAQESGEASAAGGNDTGQTLELLKGYRPSSVTEFVTLDYVETPAEDVLNAIMRATGKNIMWSEGAKKDTRVTVHVRNVDWRDALNMVLSQCGGVILEETPTRVLIDTPKPITAEWVEDDLKLVIETVGRIGNASIIVGPRVQGTVTARVVNQPWTRALEAVVKTAGFVVVREGNVLRVVSPEALQQQLVTRVFRLKYVMPPDTYRPKIDSEYLSSASQITGSDARRAFSAAGASAQAVYGAAPGRPGGRTPSGGVGAGGQPEQVEFPLFEAVRRILTPGVGEVTYDPNRNALICRDTEPVLKQLDEVIARIDTEPEQVYVDVKFVTVAGPITTADNDNVTDLLEFGVDWTSGLTATHTGPSGIPSTFPWGGSTPRFGTSPASPGTLSFAQLTTILQLLKSDGNARIVQAPKLTVLDHHEATIFVGQTVRFAETVSASSQQGGVELAAQEALNSPVDTGFQILLIPHIVPGTDKVIMTMIPKRDTLDKFQTFEFGRDDLEISLPQISSDTVVTKMLLRDKETAVIGGLIDEGDDEVINKVPFLGDIPLLGWVFKRQSIVKTRRNLIIFVTVHIIHRAESLSDIYEGYVDYDDISIPYFTEWDAGRRKRLRAQLMEKFDEAVTLFGQGEFEEARTAFQELDEMAEDLDVTLGGQTQEAVAGYLQEIEEVTPLKEGGRDVSSPALEYTVPTGAEESGGITEPEKAPEAVELVE